MAPADWVHTMGTAKTMLRASTTSITSTTIEVRLLAYSAAALLPRLLLTDMYTGKKDVMSMPPMTSS